MIQEFQFTPSRWAKLTIGAGTVQADVDALFGSVDTSGWATRPRWDAAAEAVRYQVMPTPYGVEVVCGVGAILAVERQYFRGVPMPSQQAQVIAYQPGEWSDSAVSYL